MGGRGANSPSGLGNSTFRLGDEIGNETIIAVRSDGIFQLRPTRDIDENAFNGGGNSFNDRFLDADQLQELRRRNSR